MQSFLIVMAGAILMANQQTVAASREEQDRSICLQEANGPGGYNEPAFVSCMAARGYKQDNLFPSERSPHLGGPLLSDVLSKAARSMSPGLAARQDFEQSVADYRQCLADNQTNANVCEGQRHLMDAAAQVLSSYNQRGQ